MFVDVKRVRGIGGGRYQSRSCAAASCTAKAWPRTVGGTGSSMTDPRLADHEMGLELQLVELVEQRRRAEVQGRVDDVAAIQGDIDAVQLELAATAERLAQGTPFGRASIRADERASA